MLTMKVDAEAVQWAAEVMANEALERKCETTALYAIRLYDSIKAAGSDSAIKHVLPELAALAHVDL